MTKPNLLILDDYEGIVAKAPALEKLRTLANVTILDQPLTPATYHLLQGQQVLLALRERTKMNRAFLAHCQDVELILQTGSNAYHLDQAAANEQGIVVALGKGATKNRRSVSELVLGFMLALVRKIPQLDAEMRKGAWFENIGETLDGKTLGILGYGRQGQTVARLAQAFHMNVIAWDRSGSSPTVAANGVQFLPLADVLATSDVLSIHLKLSDESRGFLTRERLYAMKRGAILINTARGAIVDELALIDALQDGQLSAAGLDVFAVEPLATDSPLRDLPNVLMTPHVGWKSEDVFYEFVAIVTTRFEDWLAGTLLPKDVLNPTAFQVERPRSGGLLLD